ncbi:MAG TPA: hypothetical protein VGU61_19740 [Noviherbaspirillum sp.]|jgi:hypothetical protein|uniref:hypothetical protein n=1 Tax=Noviherbaspirillum sp. TaxID=1926288 RepID=UPI002DDD771D|nr:hypothetical protein [Noviherbaspirillum sp.]HEV2612504.1 hypothetical protein [Noviherbaspirillum sp.]
MLDLSAIPEEIRLARGEYATVRGAHEDAKQRLQAVCGEVMAAAPRILKFGQMDSPNDVQEAFNQLEYLRVVSARIESRLEEIQSLAVQRAALKVKAWSK